MRIDTVQGEQTVDALAVRLFEGVPDALQPAQKKSLIELNPQLADIATLPPGTPVVVPENGSTEVDAGLQAALDEVTAAVNAAEAQHAEAIAQARQALQQSSDTLARKTITTTQTLDPALDAVVNQAKASVTVRTQAIATLEQSLAARVAAARKAVTDMAAPPPRHRAAGGK